MSGWVNLRVNFGLQGEGAKYRQFWLKQHLGIVLDYVREGSEMQKSLRTIQHPTILKKVKLEPVEEVPMAKKAKMGSKAKKKPDRVLKTQEVVEGIATTRLNEKQPKKKLKVEDHSEIQTKLKSKYESGSITDAKARTIAEKRLEEAEVEAIKSRREAEQLRKQLEESNRKLPAEVQRRVASEVQLRITNGNKKWKADDSEQG
ncbi:unnamed protein product [Calypogeia fissa]